MTKISTLRPGLLVSLKTSVHGNVRYAKHNLVLDHDTEDGKRQAKWETERTISDPKEHQAAGLVRSRSRARIMSVCADSAFGLLCPEDKADELEKAIADAREMADEFNRTAKLSRFHIYVIAGRVAADDVEAVKAINSEVRSLLDQMKNGVEDLDVRSIRAAASAAKNLGSMLSPEASARVQIAVEAARKAARNITQAGEQAAQEVDKWTMKIITEQRTAFLDLDEAAPVAAPKDQGRAVDLAPSKPTKAVKAAKAAQIDAE